MSRPGLMRNALSWVAAQVWRTSGRPVKDRELLYAGSAGLRIVTFHETLPEELSRIKRIVDWCRSRFSIATPVDAEAICAGRWPHSADKVLLTFDDGLESNFEAAKWLASIGVSAIFFVVPSLIDRTTEEYVRFHERFKVKAHVPLAAPGARGLSLGQLREMVAMGHRIGAHNFAHRDLGQFHALTDIRYEVANSIEMLAEFSGTSCADFAIAFGQPENVSDEAAAYLLERCPRVYACHRGLNVPGKTPKFLLDHACEPDHPVAFTRICIEGGADRRVAERARLMARRVGVLPAA